MSAAPRPLPVAVPAQHGAPFPLLPTGVPENQPPELVRALFRESTRVFMGPNYIGTGRWLVRTAALPAADLPRFGTAGGFKALGWVKPDTIQDQAGDKKMVAYVDSLFTPKPKGARYFRTPLSFDFVFNSFSHLLRVYVSAEGQVVVFNDGVVNALGDPAVLCEVAATNVAFCSPNGTVVISAMRPEKAEEVAQLLASPVFHAMRAVPVPVKPGAPAPTPTAAPSTPAARATIAEKVAAHRKPAKPAPKGAGKRARAK